MRLIDADEAKKLERMLTLKPSERALFRLMLDCMPTYEPPNPPLTLEELREMDGEPVWCQAECRPGAEGWFLVDASACQPYDFIAVGKERGIPCAGIETGYWLAYRRKPEEGTR